MDNSDEEILPPYWIKLLTTDEDVEEDDKALRRKSARKKSFKLEQRDSDEITCKICGEVFIRKNLKNHKQTKRHIDAQKQKFGEIECNLCGHKFIKGYFREHKKTKPHKLVEERLRKDKKKAQDAALSVKLEEKKTEKETYFVRPGVELPEQNQLYVNTLTVFLALRYSLSNGCKQFKISLNNNDWTRFGDIVIEVTNVGVTEIQAIQCKQIQNRNNITIVALGAEIGKFSIKEQCEALKILRSHENYNKTSFKLYTVSSIATDSNLCVCFDSASWQNKEDKEIWKDRQIIIESHKGKNLMNTTDDPDDICVFRARNNADEELNNDLSKFRVYMNQKKIAGLKYLIKTMIENKFNTSRDISDDLIKYIGEYFRTDTSGKKNEYNYKMTKNDILLKIAELLLEPYLIVSSIVEEQPLELWTDTIQKFDIIVIQNDSDIIKKIYKQLNYVLEVETEYTLNFSTKVTVEKEKIHHSALKSELFDGYGYDSRDISLQFMYLTLWKTGIAPLVLAVKDENHLTFMLKIISFLKSEKISLNFILAINFKVDHSYFPNDLKVFLNLEDLRSVDNDHLQKILDVEIAVLNFSVRLKEIVDFNMDFLERLTPDALLNILLKDYAFKDVDVPFTEEIIDNTLVLNDATVERIQTYFRNRDGVTETEHLSYLVNVKGHLVRVEVPPEL